MAAIGVAAALISGAAALPASAHEASRSTDPQYTRLEQDAESTLRSSVMEARTDFAEEMTVARSERDYQLAAPRARRYAALREAETKKERRKARREYRRSAAPIKAEYRGVRSAALARRNALIDEAMSKYLLTLATTEFYDALKEYRAAVVIAGDTLDLALESGRDTFTTDNADERAQFMADLEEATTNAEMVAAWRTYQFASIEDRLALQRSIAAAADTYRSARAEARRAYRQATGEPILRLGDLPFTI